MVKMAVKIAANRMVMLAVVCALVACGKSEDTSTTGAAASGAAVKPSLSVQLVRPLKQDWPLTLTAHGAIAPWQEAVIGAEVSGLRLMDVLVNVGDGVRKGQLLASLRADSLQADLAASRASVAEAQALLQEAQANAERARSLRQSDAVSAQEAQRALTGEQTAQARVDALKAQVASNELRLAQSRILAPDDGIISARLATAGTMVQPGQELFRLIRQSRLEWRAEVAAADVARLTPGLLVSLKAPGTAAVQGRVRSVAPTVDAVTRNGLVYVDLPVAATQSAGVRPGMFASGTFELSRASALTVPQGAVLLRDGFSLVFAVKDGKVRQTKVQIGRRQGDRIEVLQGITPETDLVASGVGFLVDGETVRVVPATKP
ncbi:MAG TPA: efflux RND transporter periplasmic adaptor subunit [Aquabacterium sp.]|nr:efflux RND transporter periplasmic adaptor subunit [Aquabacterium sp.]